MVGCKGEGFIGDLRNEEDGEEENMELTTTVLVWRLWATRLKDTKRKKERD